MLFDRITCYEVIDGEVITPLAYPVDASDTLIFFSRVPGQLKVNKRIGNLQIQPGTSGFSGKEYFIPGIIFKLADQFASRFNGYLPVKLNKTYIVFPQQASNKLMNFDPLRKNDNFGISVLYIKFFEKDILVRI